MQRGSVSKPGEITLDQRAPSLEEFGQLLELREADACIDVRQIELAAGKRNVAGSVRQIGDAMEAQLFDAFRLGSVVDDQGAAFDRREVLVRMKAERGEIPESADVATLPARADDERGVLDDTQLTPPREREQRIHVDERRRVMRRHDRAGARRDRRFDLGADRCCG